VAATWSPWEKLRESSNRRTVYNSKPLGLTYTPELSSMDAVPLTAAPPQIIRSTVPRTLSTINGPLRQALLMIGSQITLLMATTGKTPEIVAKDTGIEVDTIYSIMTGKEVDVTVRNLDALASYLGARFVPQVQPNAAS
jgi:hypothetical protein